MSLTNLSNLIDALLSLFNVFFDETARKLWKDPNRVEVPTKWVDEARTLLIAKLDEEIGTAVFTLRKNTTRIISVRKARDNEKKVYHSSRI
jgi:uncharacterized DUF497 family protein